MKVKGIIKGKEINFFGANKNEINVKS